MLTFLFHFRSDLRARLEVSRELFNVYLKNFRSAKKKLAQNPEGRQFKFRYDFCLWCTLCFKPILCCVRGRLLHLLAFPNAVSICDRSVSALLVNSQST